MTLYHLAVALHVAAACLWLGHMFFWSLFSGPALKKIQPAETAGRLRAVMLWRGGLGWPALAVLAVTGLYQMRFRGVTLGMLADGTMLQSAAGRIIAFKLLLVTAPMHAFAQRRTIEPADLKGQPLVLFEPGGSTRNTIEAFFKRESLAPKVVSETENVEVIKALVRAGVGMTIVPYQAVAKEVRTTTEIGAQSVSMAAAAVR